MTPELRAAPLLVIDFETYYDSEYTLKKMSTTEYVYDPRFEVVGVSVRFGANRVWMEEAQFRAFAEQLDWSKVAGLAHHAQFDGLILWHHYGRVQPAYWYDTLSMARAVWGDTAANDLGSLMERYGVGQKGHQVHDAKGKRRADFSRHEWLDYGVYGVGDVDGTAAVFERLVPHVPAEELDLIDVTVRMYTEPGLVLDTSMMAQYVGEEAARKQALIDRVGADKKTLSSADKFAGLLSGMGYEVPMKQSPTAKQPDGSPKLIPAFAKTDPAFQEMLLGSDEELALLCEARLNAKSAGNETRSIRLLQAGSCGRALPVYLKYAGAGTYRWSGGDKTNWQNFERTNKKNPRKGVVRKSICAPAGYKIVAGDASQIEARFNAWFSGEQYLVDLFASGADVYSRFGTTIYNRPVDRKNNPEDEVPGHVAKTAILGLGYQMGHLRFGAELLKGANGGAPVQFVAADLEKLHIDPGPFLANPKNVEAILAMPSRLSTVEKLIHWTVAHYIVEVYRSTNSRIKANWGDMKQVIELMASGWRGRIGRNQIIEVVDDGLLLPSGMVMHYRGLRDEGDGQYSYMAKRGERSRLYGGMLTENLCQALCRIIVSDAMHRLAKEGWRPRAPGARLRDGFKVASMEHDAIIGLTPEAEAPYWSNLLLQYLSTPPSWAPDLPLAAEGGFGDTLASAK